MPRGRRKLSSAEKLDSLLKRLSEAPDETQAWARAYLSAANLKTLSVNFNETDRTWTSEIYQDPKREIERFDNAFRKRESRRSHPELTELSFSVSSATARKLKRMQNKLGINRNDLLEHLVAHEEEPLKAFEKEKEKLKAERKVLTTKRNQAVLASRRAVEEIYIQLRATMLELCRRKTIHGSQYFTLTDNQEFEASRTAKEKLKACRQACPNAKIMRVLPEQE